MVSGKYPFPLILGPTAVGKSEVALKLATSSQAEIISCDSRAIYEGMDIGTAKPPVKLRRQVPHHLIDIKKPEEPYDVIEFRRDVKDAIETILARDKYPILVGGSTLYVKSLTDEFFSGPSADPDLRNELKEQPSKKLYEKLKEVDPVAAQKIHPHDEQRIIRALEVYTKTDRPISELQNREGVEFKYDFLKIGLRMKRKRLYERIDTRVDKMFERGLVEEAKKLKPRLDLGMQAYKTIGYTEIFAYLDGDIPLEEAREEIKKNTRHLAKRQLAWFKDDPEIKWIDVANKTAGQVARAIKSLPNYPQL